MKKYWIVVFFLALIGITEKVQARHIIGGSIDYECLGEGNYKFTLKVYRDCGCSNCAGFDTPALISIYSCTPDSTCFRLGQNDPLYVLSVPLDEINPVEAPDYPCLIPPEICVEEGIYSFSLSEYGISLPNIGESYHISYQRCCRNQTINNIFTPDDVGATYTVEITPLAQELCNNSPKFKTFPPTVICADAALEFDHSAVDPDGDQLVYEFAAPLTGGGPILTPPAYESCQGAQPSPPCPPPYGNVSFIVPNYSPRNPMGGDPIVSIDANTGLITGTPDVLGQFVVGVYVSEFRDGQLLSRVFRDFQFNVASCDATVVADVLEDSIVNDQEFLINACGEYTVSFINESFQERFIDFFEWRFDINGEEVTSNEWNPTITFPGVGDYNGQLILNPETDCGDTANIFVQLFPDITADFEYEYDTCVAGEVQFNDLSVTGAGEDGIVDWSWNFGDGGTSRLQNPVYQYTTPGEIPVSLRVTDINNCSADTTQFISYFPVPALIVIAPSAFAGCTPADIFFDNLSFPIDSTYDINWDFGDGGTSTDISPTHTFDQAGDFTVSVDITSPIGCETDTTFTSLISMEESPLADFSFLPEEPSNLEPTLTFTDLSERANRWEWDFGNGATSLERSPVYTYPDTGRYVITQVVTHPNGCADTIRKNIDIQPEVRYFLPNAFTPNGDAVNDVYKGVGLMDGATDFEMSIWNRWGEMVFLAKDPEEAWNGQKFNSGQNAPPGVYVVKVKYRGPRGEDYQLKGFATLVR